MSKFYTAAEIDVIGQLLNNNRLPLSNRFRALFILRNLACNRSVEWIGKCFNDSSALLKHELAYCLGQTQNLSALSVLEDVLNDEEQETIVRHEAGEALGALGCPSSLKILEKYIDYKDQAIAETCILAVQRIKWIQSSKSDPCNNQERSPYNSIDPAPSSPDTKIDHLCRVMVEQSMPLWERYRALFALRNINTNESIAALAKGLYCEDSALFRHEVAYALGQAQSVVAVPDLISRLECKDENHMVRHECAEALGAIATEECQEILQKYLNDSERVVRESCEVALDMADYEKGEQFQYAVINAGN